MIERLQDDDKAKAYAHEVARSKLFGGAHIPRPIDRVAWAVGGFPRSN